MSSYVGRIQECAPMLYRVKEAEQPLTLHCPLSDEKHQAAPKSSPCK